MVDQATTYQRLTASGRTASATVTGVRSTGAQVEGDPELELELEVDLDGVRRDLRCRQVFSRLAAREIGVGLILAVRFDPEDPSILAVA
jgi:hypothetical protein